jgi:hypothetical protein
MKLKQFSPYFVFKSDKKVTNTVKNLDNFEKKGKLQLPLKFRIKPKDVKSICLPEASSKI